MLTSLVAHGGAGPPDDPKLWVSRPDDGIFAIASPFGRVPNAAVFALERSAVPIGEAGVAAASIEDPRSAALRKTILQADAAWQEVVGLDPSLRGTGASLAVLSLLKAGALVAHMGDCRVYQFRAGQVQRTSTEHKHQGVSRPSGRPYTVVVRVFGTGSNPDVNVWSVEPGDVFALSAGVHELVNTDELVSTLEGEQNLAVVATRLINLARERGATDHFGIVLVRVPGNF